jgi:hypothetical protein
MANNEFFFDGNARGIMNQCGFQFSLRLDVIAVQKILISEHLIHNELLISILMPDIFREFFTI